MSPRSRRFRHRRAAALTAGVTTALVAFLPAASAAPGLHPGWEPVLASSLPDDDRTGPSRSASGQLRVAAVDPDLLRTDQSPADPDHSADVDSGLDGYSGHDDGYGSSDVDSFGADPVNSFSAVRSRPDGAASPLASGGIPATALEAYTRAAAAHPDCGISWSLLAAIGRVESNHGRFAGATLHTDGLSSPPIVGIALTGAGDTARITDSDGGQFDGDAVHDRAVGPMQFIPTTWASYGADGNGDGRRDPFNVYDAAAAAAKYLCAAGKDLTTVAGQRKAVFAYNHSDSYVTSVLSLAATYAGTPPPSVPTAPGPAPQLPPVDPGRPPALPPSPPVEVPLPPVVEVPVPPVEVPVPPVVEEPVPPVVEEPVPPVVEEPAPPVVEEPAPPVVEEPVPPVVEEPVPPVVEEPVPPVVEPAPPVETPAPVPEPSPCATEAEAAAAFTVDVVDGTGDPALAGEVAAALTAGGVPVGTVRTAEGVVSGIAHPESEVDDARLLAEALDAAGLLRVEPVDHVTVVLGATDSAALVAAIRGFTGVECAAPADADG